MLSPKYSANLANAIYMITEPEGQKIFKLKYKNDIRLEDASSTKINGKTGALILLKNTHTMGIAACGKGHYKGQAIIALKGTASGYDVLTDLNAGLKRFSTGGAIHQGFYYTFQSFLPQLEEFSQNLPHEIHTIHCVGHSLGGALATLVADWLSSNTGKIIKLYTFGSPRVGLEHFASGCKPKIKFCEYFPSLPSK